MGCCVMEKEIINKYNVQLRSRYYVVFMIMSRFYYESHREKTLLERGTRELYLTSTLIV
jgi:hypothetical protein